MLRIMESTLSALQFPTLSRAPIAEALVDIVTELPSNVTLDELRAFYSDDIKKGSITFRNVYRRPVKSNFLELSRQRLRLMRIQTDY